MSRIKKILASDKKDGDDQSAKKDKLTTKRGKDEQLLLLDMEKRTIDILEENESLYNQAKKALRDDDDPKRCMEILNYFIENDLALRRIIANKDSPYTFKSTKIIIELQSYYNFFRITLLSEVVNYLVLSYNQVKKYINKDYDLAFKWYKYAEIINELYIDDLNEILHRTQTESLDEHQVKIYNEVFDAFEEVKKIGLQSIRVLMKQTVKNVTKPGTLRF